MVYSKQDWQEIAKEFRIYDFVDDFFPSNINLQAMAEEIVRLREKSQECQNAYELLGQLAKRVFPGEIDSGDALLQMVNELRMELSDLKNPSDGRCMEIFALREHRKELNAQLTAWKEYAEKLKRGFDEADRVIAAALGDIKYREIEENDCVGMLTRCHEANKLTLAIPRPREEK